MRQMPSVLVACLVTAGLAPSITVAQTSAGGNPVDRLPIPSFAPTQPSSGQILDAPVLEQPSQNLRLTPLRFEIEGVQSIAFDKVAELFSPLVGQPSTVAQMIEIARQVTAIYQSQGYALSFCYIPEQDFKAGAVRVVAVEGYIDAVTIEGDAGKSEPKIRDIAEQLRQNRPLQLAAFERYTQLLAQLPGLSVEASAMPPASTDGAGSLTLKVSQKPLLVSVATDTSSSKVRAVITGVLNNPLVTGSRLSASTLQGGFQDESFTAAAYSQMVGSEGLTLSADLSLYRGNPDALLGIQPVIKRFTTNRRAELSGRYPLKLRSSASLYLQGGLYGVNNIDDYTDQSNGATLSDEVKVRAVFAQASYITNQDDQSRSLTLKLSRGINALGAGSSISSNISAPLPANPAKLDFTRVQLELIQQNRWGANWGTAVTFATQYSPHTLPLSERISFGSSRLARAYAPGAAAGDSGWGLGVELNRAFLVDMTYLKQIQPFVLLESARVYSRAGSVGPSKLASASLGVRLSRGALYTVDLAAAKPLGDVTSDNPEREIRYSLMLRYSLGQP